MASNNPSTSIFATSKRSACDRCRKQKLRCPVRANDTQQCSRCLRAGVPCVTGYTRAMGRSGHDFARGNGFSRTSHAAEMRSRRPEASPSHSASPSTTRTISSTLSDQSTDDSSLSSALLAGEDQDLHSFSHDHLVLDSFSGSYGHPQPLHSAFSFPHVLDLDYHLDERHLSGLSPQQEEVDGCMSNIESIMSEEAKLPSTGSLDGTLSWAECDLRLSQLSVDLCRQLELCKVPIRQTYDHGDLSRNGEGSIDTSDQGYSNAFGDALCSTSKFLAVFQLKGRPADNRSSEPPLSFTCVLNLFSCYLRIITIFDSLLLRLCEQLSHGGDASTLSSAKSSDPQTLPGLQLAGFPVQQGILQAKILVQTIEHQFETIEKTLGLPVELRVSDRRDAYPDGLLHREMERHSLLAVMQCLGGSPTGLVPGEDIHVAGSLASLRENIVKVRRVLDA